MFPLDQASEEGGGGGARAVAPIYSVHRVVWKPDILFCFLFILCKCLRSSIQRQQSEGYWHCSELKLAPRAGSPQAFLQRDFQMFQASTSSLVQAQRVKRRAVLLGDSFGGCHCPLLF